MAHIVARFGSQSRFCQDSDARGRQTLRADQAHPAALLRLWHAQRLGYH